MTCKKQGFTLIELLVVVLIIGILSAVALPQYTLAVEKGRAAEVLVNMKHIREALQLEYLANPKKDSIFPLVEVVDLGGGTWSEDGTFFCTKNFLYFKTSGQIVAERCTSFPKGCEGECATDPEYVIDELFSVSGGKWSSTPYFIPVSKASNKLTSFFEANGFPIKE